MSKKNLSMLMDGFMGEAKSTEQVAEQPKEQEVKSVEEKEIQENKPQEVVVPEAVEDAEATAKMKSKLEAKRKENVGRPKKGDGPKSTKKPMEIRATFIVDPDLLRKVKYISLVEGALLKDVIAEALNNYVDAWEEKNKKIRLPKAK